jgi:hypothetical protein
VPDEAPDSGVPDAAVVPPLVLTMEPDVVLPVSLIAPVLAPVAAPVLAPAVAPLVEAPLALPVEPPLEAPLVATAPASTGLVATPVAPQSII